MDASRRVNSGRSQGNRCVFQLHPRKAADHEECREKADFSRLYRPAGLRTTRIPDVKDARIRGILADCWERTKDMEVPQFRDGECEVRRLWDEAVAETMGWDAAELSRLRHLLHQEPHVSGLGYGQYADEAEEEQEWDEADEPLDTEEEQE